MNKKDREKKKQQDRKEKERKREERKANTKDGNNLDSMMAYVDEYGNISSTPPDPGKKIEIREEDIVIGVPRRPHVEEDTIRKGTVIFFNESKGFGFIKDMETQESIFVHANGLLDQIKENNLVTFETQMGKKGLNAVEVKVIRGNEAEKGVGGQTPVGSKP